MHAEYLWAPGRLEWVTRLHKNMPKGCIFCRIAGDDARVPSRTLYKDKTVMVIMNIFPYNPGHLQVVPVRHVEWPDQLTKEEQAAFYGMVNKTIKLLKKSQNPEGFNIGMNLGRTAGQSITHLHYQIVPRYASDAGFTDTIAGTKVMPETLDQTYKRLMKHVDILK